MRIIQITDLHIPIPGEDTHGVDVRTNFLKLIEAIPAFKPDVLVVTGDLCLTEGRREVYEWVKPRFDALNIPYYVISGNHDDPALLAEVFQVEEHLQNGRLFYEEMNFSLPMLFLDTTIGVLSEDQLTWLNQKLAILQGPVLLFIHHPPIKAGVPFMDNQYILKNWPEVFSCLEAYQDSVHVFSGHYHTDKTILRGNVAIHITPSCYFQIDQWSQEFKVDHYRVGFREIIIENQTLLSTVKYL